MAEPKKYYLDDKAILDMMIKFKEIQALEPLEPLELVKYTRYPLERLEPQSSLDPFKDTYKQNYSIESGNPKPFTPDSMPNDLFELYKDLDQKQKKEAEDFLKKENEIVIDYFKQNPKKDTRPKMM